MMQRFYWREMKTDEPPKTYAVAVNNFGAKPANCIATCALRNSADKFAEIYEKVYEVVDEAHSAVITGSIKYEEYSKKLKDMNVKLAESNVGININIISKNSIEDLFTIVPAQLIKVTDPEFVDEYDLMQGGYYGGY